jgi:hypothetical protein
MGTPPPSGEYGNYNIGSGIDYARQFEALLGPGMNLPREGPANLPGEYNLPGQIAFQEQIGNPLENIDFANHPALKSALKAFEAATMPGLVNQAAASGLTRAGSSLSALEGAKAQMALPVMQQLMGLEMQNKGIDVGQRAGDIQALLGQRGQDIEGGLGARGQDIQGALGQLGLDVQQRGQDVESLLNRLGLGVNAGLQARGQDVNATLTGRSQDLQQRGQDLDAILQQGAQALQAQGLSNESLAAGLSGMLNINQADMSRMLSGLSQAGQWGGLMRGISQEQADAMTDEEMRQYNLAREFLFGPMNAVGSTVGSSTSTQGGK